MPNNRPNELRNYRMMDIPGYMDWSERKLAAGESPDLIAHLDATGMTLRPSELPNVSEGVYEELLDGLKVELGEEE